MSPAITVILPVYNGIDYLHRTIESLLAQEFKDFEVIAVDDGSTDGSWEYLQGLPSRDSRFKVRRTDKNLGIVPKVINSIRSEVLGQYFVYSSQDDIYSADWLLELHLRAVETDADATIPDLVFWFEDNSQPNRMLPAGGGDKSRILSGPEAFELSLDWTIPGNALWRSKLLREMPYFDFAMNADEYTARYYFLRCNRVAFSGGTFYYRRDNKNAITIKFTEKMLDLPRTELMLCVLMSESGLHERAVSKRLALAVASMFHLASDAHANGFPRSVIDEKLDEFRAVMKEVGVHHISRSGFRLRDRLAYIAIQDPLLSQVALAAKGARRYLVFS